MQSQRKTQETPYKGTQDLASLLNADEWSPTSLFPQTTRKPPPYGPYLEYIKRLSKKGHPDLKYLCAELDRQNGGCHAERSRVVVFEYPTNGTTESPRKELFRTSKALKEYLSGTFDIPCNRLYIQKDISTDYVEVFGSQFSIEPRFWAQHLRTTDRETSKTAGNVSALPSMKSLDTSFSLIYPEYTIIDEPAEEFTEEPRLRNAKSLFANCNLYRKVTLIRQGEFYDGVAAVNRRASFWSRVNPNRSWDSLILVDPPIIHTGKDGNKTGLSIVYSHDFPNNKMVGINVSHHAPYQDGYIDFLPSPIEDAHKSQYEGPPRTSLFDDLIHYHSQPNPSQILLPTPNTAAALLKTIVAGIWMNSIAYVNLSVLSLELAVEQSRKHPPSSTATSYHGLEWLENNLFHIYSWKRRCSQLHHWADWNLEELHIPASTLKTDQQDWLFLKKRLENCETCSRDIVASALGLLSLIESHKSVEEAESARVLALLGTVYLPLSLAAGILSMGGPFMPGQHQFWIFFAVAGPLMVLSGGALYMRRVVGIFQSWDVGKSKEPEEGDPKRTATFVKEPQDTV